MFSIMQGAREPISSIIRILSRYPEGRMMKDLAADLGLNRNAVAKYLGILFQQGRVDIRLIGKAKVFTLSKRVPYSILLDLSTDCIVATDRGLYCAGANDRFCAWAGCTRDEIAGKPVQNLPVPLFQRSGIASLARSAISTVTGPVRIPCIIRDRDCLFEVRGIPVVFEDSTTGGALLISDITTTETAAGTIACLEERYRALAAAQSEYIVCSTPDGTITFANPAFAALAGLGADLLVGKRARLRIPDEDCAEVSRHFRSITPGTPEQCIEHRVVAHSGEVRWIRWTNRGIFRDGVLAEFHSHGTDITDLKMARDRLRYYHENTEKMIREKTDEFLRINRDLLREIQKRRQTERSLQKTQFCVNNSSEMIVWTDEAGSVTSSNRSALSTLGLQPGQPACFLRPGMPGSPHPLPWEEIWNPVRQDGFFLFEALIRDRRENALPVEVLANYLSYDDSQSCCFFIRDISRRKDVQERLRLMKISIDNAYDEVFWADMDGNILYVNDAVCRTTGYTREELHAMKIFALDIDLTPEIWERSMEGLRRNKKQLYQTRHQRKDGAIIDVETSSVHVTRGSGEFAFCFVRDITARRKIEAALEESEELFAATFYHGPLMLSIIDIGTGRYLDINNKFTRVSGYSREEVIGKTTLELGWISPGELECLMQDLKRTGRVQGREIRLNKKGGGTLFCRYFGERITVAGRERLIFLAEDITERKRAEEALHCSEEKYRRIFESSIDVYFETDPAGVVGIVSPSVHALTGWSPEDLVGNTVAVLYADPADCRLLADRLGRDDAVSGFEATMKMRDGTPVRVSINARIRYSAAGEPDGVIGSIRDMSEQVAARNALAASEEKFRLAMKADCDALWDVNIPRNTAIFSPRWYSMLGYEPGELPGTYASWESLVHPDDMKAAKKAMGDRLRSRMEASAAEYRVRTKQGDWIWIQSRGMVVERDAGGNPVRVVGTSTEILKKTG